MTRELQTLVCFAVAQESRPFRRRLCPSLQLRVLVTGMGAQNAARAFQEALATHTPDRILTCGFAGGLHPDYQRNEVFFETSSEDLALLLLKAGGRPARFLCSDRIATTVEEKRALRSRSAADLVEMESGVIQPLCKERGLPCATVRVVSDTADENLPLDFNRLMTRDYRLSGMRLAASLMMRPARIPALWRLGRSSACAAERLAEVLEKALRPRPTP